MTRTIPYENLKTLNKPFETSLKRKFADFLDKGWYILGDEVALFEQEFAAYHGEKYVVGVANGLDALILSLKCCNFPKGSEVIVPSNTYIATILAILQCDLVPVFVEPDLRTYNIDHTKIEAAITRRTVAIMVVHLYGRCCEMSTILNLASSHSLKLVEDCAQAHGATLKGQLAGTFGDFGAFSFYPTKNLGALGDAGAIICKSEEDYELLKKLRNYGSGKKYHNEVIGYNSRLDELQAAFLRIKLPALDVINAHKNKLAERYMEQLTDQLVKPLVDPDYGHVYHIFNIRHAERETIQSFLKAQGIGTEVHYPIPPHKQAALHSMNYLNFPIASEIHTTTLSLPCSFAHNLDDTQHVVDVLNSYFK